jgi:hypothetical protein
MGPRIWYVRFLENGPFKSRVNWQYYCRNPICYRLSREKAIPYQKWVQVIHYINISVYLKVSILSRVCGDYIRRVLDWQLDLLDHTQLHTITMYTLYNFAVHYSTCRVFLLCLHWLPVFQYRRIRSPATLQLFFEDCCSARILTRNWNCPIMAVDVRAI